MAAGNTRVCQHTNVALHSFLSLVKNVDSKQSLQLSIDYLHSKIHAIRHDSNLYLFQMILKKCYREHLTLVFKRWYFKTIFAK